MNPVVLTQVAAVDKDVLKLFPKKFRRDNTPKNGQEHVRHTPCSGVKYDFFSKNGGQIMRKVISDRVAYVVPHDGTLVIPVSGADAHAHGLFVHGSREKAIEYAKQRISSRHGFRIQSSALDEIEVKS